MLSSAKMACVVAMAVLLSACASSPKSGSYVPLSAQQRQQQLEQLQEFKLTGALGVTAPNDSVSGSLSWQQQGPYYQASMTNFVGISIFELETDSRGATIKGDGEVHQAQSASALLDYLSGWSLPIEEMPLWLKGMASSTGSAHQWDQLGRLVAFELKDNQGRDWLVSYPEFFPDALALPKRVVLESKTDRTKIKLVVRQWQL